MGIVVIRQLSKLLKSMFLVRESFSKDFQCLSAAKIPTTYVLLKMVWKYLIQKYLENGGRYRARTSDPLLVRQVLSQLS